MTAKLTTWEDVAEAIEHTKPQNVKLRISNDAPYLEGNDGTVLTISAYLALGYVKSDWDAINCQATR